MTAAGETFCWGSNRWGQLGTGGEAAPQARSWQLIDRVKGSLRGRQAVTCAAGAHHGLGVTTSGSLYGWGRGFEGATGLGNDALDR